MNLEDQLARSLNSFATDGLFVIGGIPHDKLCNAIQNFPIDPRDTVLALIDATVMGSCKKGMAFGLRGVYWKNDWTTKTQRNYMSWDELSSIKHLIGAKSFDVILGPGNACNLSAEDNIADKAAAIESLTTVIEELRAEYAKSKPLFKLKCSKLIAQVRDEITGPSREHARVMLEGMLGETKDSADAANREVFDKLMAALAD